MVVTLDQLRPYDHDPRVTRNPAYEEIKASIRERGLDAPPRSRAGRARRTTSFAMAATRGWRSCASCGARPRRNASSALRACSARGRRGEIVALTGHLAENELRGGLTFIERALGRRERRASSTSRKAAGAVPERAGAAADCRRLSGAAVAHQPHERRGALPARRSRRCCTAAGPASGGTGSRCCARRASAPGSGVRWAAP